MPVAVSKRRIIPVLQALPWQDIHGNIRMEKRAHVESKMNIKVILLSKPTTQFVSTSNLKNNGKLKNKKGRGIWDFFFNKLIVKTNTHHLGEPSFNNL